MWGDVKYGARMLIKNPSFAAVAILALALGIGANTAIFSVVNAVLLRPLPYSEPEQLAIIWQTNEEARRKLGSSQLPVTPADFVDYRAQTTQFEGMAAFARWDTNLIRQGEPEKLNGVRVTADFLPVLRVRPALGRAFLSEDDKPGASRVVIISHGLWQRRFGGDPNVINREINLSDLKFTVVGVLPADFRFAESSNLPRSFNFTERADIWMPFAIGDEAMRQMRGAHNYGVVARLKLGATLTAAQAELTEIAARIKEANPKGSDNKAVVIGLQDQVAGKVRPALIVLFGAVAFVLLISCANVANLMLARAVARGREMAIRIALGASRVRLVRQLLIESLLLALVGGTLGVLLAWWGTDLLLALAPDTLPRIGAVDLNASVLAFSLLLSFATGIGFGLIPALQAAKQNPNQALKAGARGATDGSQRARNSFVVVQVALALMLLITAGLLTRSFVRLLQVEPGFNPANVVTMDVSLPGMRYRDRVRRVEFFRQMIERVRALPQVEDVGINYAMPLNGTEASNSFALEGRAPLAAGEWQSANLNIVNDDYFRALEIPLQRGRAFTEQDGSEVQPVAIIDEMMARRYFADEDPLGKRIALGSGTSPDTTWYTIVGVVSSVRHEGIEAAPRPALYFHYPQYTYQFTTLAVRSRTTDAASLARDVQRAIKEIDADQPVSNIRTLADRYEHAIAPQRFNMTLLGIFASTALVLAAVGIFGVINYTVAQRTREIGIRIALGAQGTDVLRLVIKQGLILTCVGILIGLTAAFFLTRYLASLLYGVDAIDPTTFAGVSALLALSALLACYIPARRAARVDPMVALRYE